MYKKILLFLILNLIFYIICVAVAQKIFICAFHFNVTHICCEQCYHDPIFFYNFFTLLFYHDFHKTMPPFGVTTTTSEWSYLTLLIFYGFPLASVHNIRKNSHNACLHETSTSSGFMLLSTQRFLVNILLRIKKN